MTLWLLLAAAIVLARPMRLGRQKAVAESSLADLARLLSIAAAAGMPLGTALAAVAGDLTGRVGDEVTAVLRRARTTGLTAALIGAPGLGALGAALARSHSTGSPLSHTLDAHLTAHRSEQVAKALETARTAPVRVMVPLALLLLPGFTALVVGPTLLDHVLDMTRFGR
ncbi:MAG TPA: type II secretion system F family protein [Acidimicrobiia bacterium]|nr:type II secretion system F family protein [Acidimicrobiia bacterium]